MRESRPYQRHIGLSASLSFLLRLVVMSTPLLSACHGRTAEPLAVDREVLVRGVVGQPNAITRAANGSFVVAGVSGVGWAFSTTADGKLLWKYQEAADASSRTPYQSEFRGAVALTNGNVLLCGETHSADGGGLIVVLDPSGQVVERRLLFPKQDRRFFSSGFNRCLRWNKDILLMGHANDGVHAGSSWLVGLDQNGAQQWEIVSAEVPAGPAVELEGHDLVVMGGAVAGGVRVSRVNQRFETVATRVIGGSGFFYALVRSVEPARGVEVVSYDRGGKATLYTLNEDLKDKEPPRALETIDIDNGCGYVLADGSLALFGNVMVGGVYVAAVAHMGQGKATATHVFENFSGTGVVSLAVRDAIPVSQTGFVSVRDRASRNTDEAGIVMSWGKFE